MKTLVEQRKDQKRNQILSLIRHSNRPLSRFDIKKLTTYSMTTVSNTITELLQQGFIFEDVCSENNRMGRKPIFLHLNPDGGYFIGVEFNIQNLHCVILNFCGDLIYETSCETTSYTSVYQFIDRLEEQIKGCFSFLGDKQEKILGVGLGMPGYIDIEKGIALHYAYIDDWVDIPIIEIMEERLSLPVYIINNVSTMGLAFKWLNQYRQKDDFVFVSIRTGARSILFVNGEPYLGKNCSSGELGHLKIPYCSKLCECGQRGCLNTEVSVLSIRAKILDGIQNGKFSRIKELAGGDPANVNVDLLVDAALENDAESIALIRETAQYLGFALSSVINLISPPHMIISYRLCRAGELFLKPLRESIALNAVPENVKNMQFSPSPCGDNIGAIGAATLVLEENFNAVCKVF
ncbi:MAG: ROK family protein [Enterocloster asparagiformis]|nr:ROK family protein [Enterocloster asparagiformis]